MSLPVPGPIRKKKAEKHEGKKKSLGREISSWAACLLAALLLVALVDMFAVQLIRVDGTSMENTLHNGEVLLVSKLGGAYERGDVVICRYPGRVEFSVDLGASLTLSRHTVFVKRLVALPGDTVEIRQGKLYVNDTLTPDPKYMGSTPRDYARRVLGADEYFVIGDNRFTSRDSRSPDVGPISGDMLRGKVKSVVWPLGRIRPVD